MILERLGWEPSVPLATGLETDVRLDLRRAEVPPAAGRGCGDGLNGRAVAT